MRRPCRCVQLTAKVVGGNETAIGKLPPAGSQIVERVELAVDPGRADRVVLAVRLVAHLVAVGEVLFDQVGAGLRVGERLVRAGAAENHLTGLFQPHLRGGQVVCPVTDQGEQPEKSSGAWGTFAKAVEGTAKLFGNQAALKALKEGEEHGVELYEDALDNEELPVECRSLIDSKLLPQARMLIVVLDEIMERQSNAA